MWSYFQLGMAIETRVRSVELAPLILSYTRQLMDGYVNFGPE